VKTFRYVVQLLVSHAALLTLLLVTACASDLTRSTRAYLDEQTGVTVTCNKAPIVLFRDSPSKAAYARNLLHVGPIQVNRSGNYEYFLWLGIWDTLQQPGSPEQRDGFESIVIFADGEPLPLDLAGWTPSAIGASAAPYVKPFATAADAYYPVTLDQIRFMAQAKELAIRTTGALAAEYRPWDTQEGASMALWTFLRSAGN
jgi:hypothetical protein